MKRDLSQGSIIKNLFVMSIPTMLGMLSQMIYDLVDIFWIGKLSAEAVAGVTIFSSIFWLLNTPNDIIGQSSISLISQRYGANDEEGTKKAIEQTITFKIFIALLTVIASIFFIKPLIGLFSDDRAVIDAALNYGYLRLFFLPMMFSSYSVNTILRCLGDAKTPMFIMFFSSIVNIVLDPVLMFDIIPGTSIKGFGMGIFGVAVATIVSQTIAFLIGFIYIFRGKAGIKPRIKGLFRLDKIIGMKLLTIGLPNGIEGLSRNIAGVICMKFVAIYGTTIVAAYGVGSRIFGLAFMPLVGFSMGGAAIVGQSLGAENIDRSKKTAVYSSIISGVVMLIFAIIAFVFGENIISIFNNTPEIIFYGAQFLQFGSIGLSFLGFAFGFTIVFSGSGYNFPFVIGSAISRWAIQVPILLITILWLKLEVVWVWSSFIFSDVCEGIVYFIFYKKGKWKTKRVK